MRFTFTDYKDTSKLMIYYLPKGQFTLNVQVKSLSDGFYPRLYIKYYEDLDTKLSNIEFPPGGDPGFFVNKNWDKKVGIMHYQETFDNVKSETAGLALTLFDGSILRKNKTN